MKKIFFFLFLCVIVTKIYTREPNGGTHIYEGNLALPTAQQPRPLFCFGQNIVDKSDIQAFLFASSLSSKNSNFTEVIPNIIYGISDNCVFLAGIPIAAKSKLCHKNSSGFESVFAQLEYAFYNDDHATYANQMTFVSNIVITGKKNFPSQFAHPSSFFFGMTASHMATDWYYFISPGIIVPVSHKNNASLTFLYQWGISRNIYYIPQKLLATLLLEFFGEFRKDSHEHNLYIGPSLWITTQHFILDIGIAFPVIQKTIDQSKNNLLFSVEVGWKFNS